MRYAVILFGPFKQGFDFEGFEQKVRKVDEEAYTAYGPQVYFLNYNGQPRSLANSLGFTGNNVPEPVLGTVVPFVNYAGFANRDLWSWARNTS